MKQKPYTINPLNCKREKPYQVNKQKIDVKYLFLNKGLYGNKKYLLSSKGDVFIEDQKTYEIKKLNVHEKNGYKFICLYNKVIERSTLQYLHRLIAFYFVKRTKKDDELCRDIVHFKDWNRKRIIPENLIWVNANEMNALIAFRKAEKHTKIDDELRHKYLDSFYNDKRYTKKEINRIFGEYL